MQRRAALASLLALFALSIAPQKSTAQAPADTAAILATVQALFDAMAARDSIALASLVTTEGSFAVVVVENDSATRIAHQSLGGFVTRLGQPGPLLRERMWQPHVLIDGPFAIVWTAYDFHIAGRFNHCGTDIFTLARLSGAWRITGGSYTIQQQNCTPAPLGAP